MAEQNIGKITQIIGAVLDIKFSQGRLPSINDAIDITMKNGNRLVVEVSQHLGDDTVRCIAMIRPMDWYVVWKPSQRGRRSQYRSVKRPWDVSLTYWVIPSIINQSRK